MAIDREKVMAALTLCANGEACILDKYRNCPYSPIGQSDWYNCAAVLAADTLAMLKEQGWISVKDRLPESNEAVLIAVYDNGGKYEYQAIAVRYPCGDWDSTDEYFNQGDGEVKYWMPLPEPPEEVSGDG